MNDDPQTPSAPRPIGELIQANPRTLTDEELDTIVLAWRNERHQWSAAAARPKVAKGKTAGATAGKTPKTSIDFDDIKL